MAHSKYLVLTLVLAFINIEISFSQPKALDSLLNVVATNKQDTSVFNAYIEIGNLFAKSNPDTAIYFHNKAKETATSLKDEIRKGEAIRAAGWDNLNKGNYAVAVPLLEEAATIAKKSTSHKDKKTRNRAKKLEAASLGNIGVAYMYQGDNPKAIEYYKRSLAINEEIGYKKGMATVHGNMGGSYSSQGDHPNALTHLFKAMKMDDEIGNKVGVARHLGNIGIVYQEQKDFEKALEYHTKALKLNEELGNKPVMSTNYGNIGNIHHNLSQYPKALEYYFKALELNKEIGSKYGMSINMGNIAVLYSEHGSKIGKDSSAYQKELFNKSLDFFSQALKIDKEIGNVRGESIRLGHIGALQVKLNKYSEAELNIKKSFEIAKKNNFLELIKTNHHQLFVLYEKTNRSALALTHYKRYVELRDSILSEDNLKATMERELQFEYEKKATADSVENVKSIEIKNIEIAKQQTEIKAKKKQQYALFGGLALVLIFAFFMYNRFKVTQKQKTVIEEQKRIVEHQKEMVEEKNQEILDSITYAKRLQDAILPPLKLVKQNLENSFILYKPKDIVAGDFYWMELALVAEALEAPKQYRSTISGTSTSSVTDTILFAAADCTGHGVPGAMVSVVCSNALNRTVKEFGITEPGKILDKVTDLVIETFEKSEAEVKDGMDISLCSLKLRIMNDELKGATLKWAGANNPLWLVRPNRTPSLPSRQTGEAEVHGEKDFSTSPALPSGRLETTTQKNQSDTSRASVTDSSQFSIFTSQFSLQEIKADKQPIGKYSDRNPFTTHTVELCEGDSIYIFTDGYADQFGGEKGKKFKSSKMKELILSIQNETMEKQKELINEAFENWKGNLEQVDDVCLIGVKI